MSEFPLWRSSRVVKAEIPQWPIGGSMRITKVACLADRCVFNTTEEKWARLFERRTPGKGRSLRALSAIGQPRAQTPRAAKPHFPGNTIDDAPDPSRYWV